MKTLEVVVGAQFGSEAKGHVVQRLTERAQKENKPVQVVRVAGPNAGHTGYDANGTPWALRQIPVAAVTDGPVILGISAGSEIDAPVVLDEFDRLRDAGLLKNKFLWIHGEATMITQEHKSAENAMPTHPGQELDDMVARLGSTGKGIGAARAERLMRRAKRVVDDEDFVFECERRGIPIADPQHNVVDAMDANGHLIIEGTQGYGLGLRAGFYPQCTSSDCRAIDFMAMAGVHPWQFLTTDVWAVARIFPIRVAGNSGPLKGETTWGELGLPDERTTVTKKIRRVGAPDWDLVREAVRANGGAPHVQLAVTMVDQIFPWMRDRGYYQPWEGDEETSLYRMRTLSDYLTDIQRQTGAQVGMITTGPNTASFL